MFSLKNEKDIIKFMNPYWSDRMKVSYLQRRIVVYSCLYYELNESIIDDVDYDAISRQLVRYMKLLDKDVLKNETEFGYCMYDFDGSTGYDLYNRLSEQHKNMIYNLSMNIIREGQARGTCQH